MDLIPLFEAIEAAIDAHPMFTREIVRGSRATPSIDISREGCSARIRVLFKGKRRWSEISAIGDTPEEAAKKLVADLDTWAQAIRGVL